MAIEWVLIFLPLVFLLGWLAARLDIRNIKKNASRLPRAYMTGLSHLLRDEKDKALDAFIESEPIAPESFELRFVIGKLSRDRGEHRRALKVHKTICEREDLDDNVRKKALWELACDYFNMGFLDYAERHLTPLLKDKQYQEQALGMKIKICQLSGNYRSALLLTKELSPSVALSYRIQRAQWACQCAETLSNDNEEKRELLTEALHINHKCVRAAIMLGNLTLAEGKAQEAVVHFQSVERQNSEYMWLVVDGLLKARLAEGKGKSAKQEITRWFYAYPSTVLFEKAYLALTKIPDGGNEELAKNVLIKHHNIVAGMRWIDEQAMTFDGEKKDLWMALRETIRATVCKRFICDSCGYEVEEFFWQCSGCLLWETCHLQQSTTVNSEIHH